MKYSKHIIFTSLLCLIVQFSFSQCYDLEIVSGEFEYTPLGVDFSQLYTLEICNNEDPLPVGPHGGVKLNICLAESYIYNLNSNFSGTGSPYFSFSDVTGCEVLDQTATIPTGCFTIEITVLPHASNSPGSFIGGEDGLSCVQSNIIPSNILIANACNDTENDEEWDCTWALYIDVPVELISFEARQVGSKSLLEWVTASEVNNDFFSIEHSKDGSTYTTIGRIEGHGNSNDRLDYQFVDTDPALGINYYRLKQVDFDGAFEYSEVRVFAFDGEEKSISFYPNPSSDFIQIFGTEVGDQVYLYNTEGKEVKKFDVEEGARFELGGILDGTYSVTVLNKQGNLKFTEKLYVKK